MSASKPKHIGLVLSSVPGYSETFFNSKIRGLMKNGFKVTVFADYTDTRYKNEAFKVVYNLKLNSNLWTSCLEISKSIFRTLFVHPKHSLRLLKLDLKDNKTWNYCLRRLILNEFLLNRDLDWVHFGFGMLANGRENVAEAIGAKMAVSFRGYDLYLSPLKHEGCYHVLFKKEVAYHVLSEEMKACLLHQGICKKRISVISPAINTALFHNQNFDRKTNESPLKLTTVARLHWKKGLTDTFVALNILKNWGLDFEYTIIGTGTEKEKLLFTAHQLGLMDRINFIGKLSQEQIKSYLMASDIYIQYSIQEGFCNAVLEAQAMGLLCIVSNAEGLSENVLHGTTGWVVPKRAPKLLAEKIVEVSKLNDADKKMIRSKATTRVQTHFGLEKQAQKFFNFYNQNL